MTAKSTLAPMAQQLEELMKDDRTVGLEGGASGYECTIHYWHPTEHRPTHAHYGGRSLPEAVNRAHKEHVLGALRPVKHNVHGDARPPHESCTDPAACDCSCDGCMKAFGQ